ncbi:MAG: NADH-quinone oxidoreductase subunit A [Spirosomataceae bacterium]
MLTDFGFVLLFILGAVGLFLIVMGIAWFIRPSRPTFEKLTSYESGEEAIGGTNVRFTVRYYLVALVFVLFDVELVFLFPWATVFADTTLIAETNGLWGWFTLFEAGLFVLILGLGLAYVWSQGLLDWETTNNKKKEVFKSPVPADMYAKINEKYAKSTKK